jgi:ATP/maltotriose-dependent transcriptional regulator MalT
MILIGRTLPPAPLWRMRSKQTLRVIDESAMAFTLAEAEELFDSYGLPTKHAAQALAETWGRAAALDRAARAHREALNAGGARQPQQQQVATLNSEAEQRRAAASRLRLVKGYAEKSSVRAG